MNCAQLNILNEGAVGTPNPLIKIPGVYTLGQPGMFEELKTHLEHMKSVTLIQPIIDLYFAPIDNGEGWNFDFSKHKAPAPAVWEG